MTSARVRGSIIRLTIPTTTKMSSAPRVGSVCSGAGGFDLGFRNAGYETAWLCESDPWRRKLLARNFPGVPCFPDLTTLDPADVEPIDCLIGGTPCQDLSIGGQRAGLDGERSGLFFDYVRIRHALNVEWCVWENVAGALSSNDGLDFACILAAFVGAGVDVPAGGWPGAGVATGPFGGVVWRLLDSQYFGVPQRRRRVFVVGHLGGECEPSILFEPARGDRDPATGAETRPGTATRAGVRALGAGGRGASGPDRGVGIAAALTRGSSGPGVSAPGRRKEDDVNLIAGTLEAGMGRRRHDEQGTYVVSALDRQAGGPDDNSAQAGHLIAGALTRRIGKGVDSDCLGMPLVAHTLRAGGFDASEDGTGRGTPLVVRGEPTTRGVDGAAPDAHGVRSPNELAAGLDDPAVTGFDNYNMRTTGDMAGALSGMTAGNRMPHVMGHGTAARSCAFDPLPDGRRYAACGDGVVSSVAEWIARRLEPYIR